MFALQTLLVSIRKVFADALLRQQVREELGGLGDRELADIGISRSDIRRIARMSNTEAPAPAAPASRRHAPLAGTPRAA